MKTRTFTAVAMFVGVLAMTSGAQAETTKSGNDYAYDFPDADRLIGGEMTPGGPTIRVVKMGRRDRLLRPRIQFVPEMLKSVENM